MSRGGGPTCAGGPVVLTPVTGLPEVRRGDDVGALLAAALRAGPGLSDGDVVVVTSKVVSKAAGLTASAEAKAATVLAQSRRVVAERMTADGVTRIVQARSGPVLAAAGIDASNTGGADLLLLPEDPDSAARELRRSMAAAWAQAQGDRAPVFGVVLSDTAGRPWRVGQADFALGAAGLHCVDDLRGRPDADGRPLAVTMAAIADEIAAAADLVKGKADHVAAAHIRGLAAHVRGEDGPGAAALLRPAKADWFALGHVEAVRAALGVAPGTAEAVEIGLPTVDGGDGEDITARIGRACALAALPAAWASVPPGHPQHKRVTRRLDPAAVRLHVVQVGVRVEAPDEFTLGVTVGRLVAALAGEGVPAALAQADATSALVAFL